MAPRESRHKRVLFFSLDTEYRTRWTRETKSDTFAYEISKKSLLVDKPETREDVLITKLNYNRQNSIHNEGESW